RDEYQAISQAFNALTAQKRQLEAELADATPQPRPDLDAQIRDALVVAGRLRDLAEQPEKLASIGELFRGLNARLFLSFAPVKQKKREVHRVTSGAVALGAAPSPLEPYQGPTAREQIKASKAASAANPGTALIGLPDDVPSVEEDKSIGNVNRGERI
ncbi:MAG: hypothetical protein IT427_01945, partial [Pirellulales bacterium]|nr:hypothetical protein [Pirellulales bacterium]